MSAEDGAGQGGAPAAGAFRCGHAAIVGRPNVGKSTLLNRLVEQKLSITTRRPQTTRHRILGVKTTAAAQVLFVDTPGLHQNAGRAINRYMNRAADSAINDVDVVVMVVEALRWTDEDEAVAARCEASGHPVLVALNKVDRVKDKTRLLPRLQELGARLPGAELFPVSARSGDGLGPLEAAVVAALPAAPPLFPEDQVTDRSVRFLAAETVREKLMRRLGEELPYRLTVEIERFEETPEQATIHALVWVERESQKGIVIGQGGAVLKAVGEEARAEMEEMLARRVLLRTWVKVKANWSDDDRLLSSLGYGDP